MIKTPKLSAKEKAELSDKILGKYSGIRSLEAQHKQNMRGLAETEIEAVKNYAKQKTTIRINNSDTTDPTVGKNNVAVTARQPLRTPASTAPSDAPFKISSGVRQAQPYRKIFIYGDYGAGKTVFSAQSVDVSTLKDVLFVSVEGGEVSIQGSKAVDHADEIDFIKCKNFETLVAIHKMLVSYCQARDDDDTERINRMAEKYGFDANKRYKTVIIDSLSELNQISLSRAFADNPDDLLRIADSDDTRRDFGKNKQAMIKVIRAFRNLPMNVIATCGREWDQDERKKLGYQPRLTGALSKEVQAFWDVVGYLETTSRRTIGEDEDETILLRRLWLQPVGKFDAKNRLSSEDVTHLDNPTMAKLFALWDGKKPLTKKPKDE